MSLDINNITDHVIDVMKKSPDPRIAEVSASLVKHLHAFIREIKPTDAEWEEAVGFVVGLGKETSAKKNEVILFSDVLGASALITMMNNPEAAGKTDTALLGPFWREKAPMCALGDDIARKKHAGEMPLSVRGKVKRADGTPIAGATVDVWQASPKGLYENQDDEQPDMNLRGRFITNANGEYAFRSVRPAGYPVPTDGPVGEMLRQQGRHPYRPAHLHYMVSAPGHKVLVTQVFADDDERLATDVTFSVVDSLVGTYKKHAADAQHPEPWSTLEFDLVLHPGEMVFPAPPIP